MDLDRLFKISQRIAVRKGIIIGDTHLGVKDNADDFYGHEGLLSFVLQEACQDGRTALLGGDIYDDWENPHREDITNAYPDIFSSLLNFGTSSKLIQIQGNHDPNNGLSMAYVIVLEDGREILWTHGHYKDLFNYQASWVGKFFVGYIWRNLQMTGVFKDPTTATTRNPRKHEQVKAYFREWCKRTGKWVIFHHTHLANEGPDWNAGSWVGIGGSAIYIDGAKLTLKYF